MLERNIVYDILTLEDLNMRIGVRIMSKTKKRVITILVIVLLIIGFFPHSEYISKDGGSVYYDSILLGVYKIHRIYSDQEAFDLKNKLRDEADTLTPSEIYNINKEIDEHEGYIVGTQVRFLIFIIYDDCERVPRYKNR